MTPPADPVRERVEASLHHVVSLVTTGPCGLLRTASRTVTESARLVRTMVNLTVDGLLGWDADAGVPRLDTVDVAASPATPSGGQRSGELTDAPPSTGAVDLAIPGYEDLAASHIVARLDRLSPSELVDIRSFEIATRGRRTVVGKIDQLLARA